MKTFLLSLACIFSFGCSVAQKSEAPAFHAEFSTGTVEVNKEGVLQLTYLYPACLVDAPDKKQVRVQFDTAATSNRGGILQTIGGFAVSVVTFLLRNL